MQQEYRERKGTLDEHNKENNTPMKYRNSLIPKKYNVTRWESGRDTTIETPKTVA
jgi:hypothetical protein